MGCGRTIESIRRRSQAGSKNPKRTRPEGNCPALLTEYEGSSLECQPLFFIEVCESKRLVSACAGGPKRV